MISAENFTLFVWSWIILGVLVFFVLLFITAPYGRHSKTTWGPMLDNRIAWIIMEVFVLFVLYFFVFTGKLEQSFTNILLISFFSLHYLNRSLVFPFRLKTNGKKMPVVIIIMGMIFNMVNGFIIGYFLGNLKIYSNEWLFSPYFISGSLLFFIGMTINWQSDTILLKLRQPGDSGYKIPKGKMFKYVSAPNLLGEIIEWAGFAILTWSLPGFAFFVWTFANLVPRAVAHHRWYHKKFDDYPPERKAVFPFIW